MHARMRLCNVQTQTLSSLCSHFVKYFKAKAQAPSFLSLKIVFRKRENWERENAKLQKEFVHYRNIRFSEAACCIYFVTKRISHECDLLNIYRSGK